MKPIKPVPTSAMVEGSGTSCPPTIEFVGANNPPPAASNSWTSAISAYIAPTESFTDGNTTTYVGNEVRFVKLAEAENAGFSGVVPPGVLRPTGSARFPVAIKFRPVMSEPGAPLAAGVGPINRETNRVAWFRVVGGPDSNGRRCPAPAAGATATPVLNLPKFKILLVNASRWRNSAHSAAGRSARPQPFLPCRF